MMNPIDKQRPLAQLAILLVLGTGISLAAITLSVFSTRGCTVRVGAHAKAWAMLQAWLDTLDHAPEDCRWLIERVSSWPDPGYAIRLTEEYVGRLRE